MDNFVLNGKELSPRKLPGLYMIHCLSNDYRYYGETGNISGRIASHRSCLRRNIHPNKKLQEDWNKFSSNFTFVILYMGNEWVKRQDRLVKEALLIGADFERCYNFFESQDKRIGELNPFFKKRHSESTIRLMKEAKSGVPNEALGRKISIHGKEYPSIAQASRDTGHSRKMITRRVGSDEHPDWRAL